MVTATYWWCRITSQNGQKHSQCQTKLPNVSLTLITLCARMGLPRIIHSDQGRNFESPILNQTLQAFGITKSHTTAYHPQGDGMVKHLNRSILQLLRAYVTKETDWEHYLPLIMYAYRTTVRSSTQVSPFRLIFGQHPQFNSFPGHEVTDPGPALRIGKQGNCLGPQSKRAHGCSITQLEACRPCTNQNLSHKSYFIIFVSYLSSSTSSVWINIVKCPSYSK